MTVRFQHRSTVARSNMMPKTSEGHEPSPITGLPSPAATLAGTAPTGPKVPRIRRAQTPGMRRSAGFGRLRILPPDAPVTRSGGPLKASAGHGPERPQGPRKRGSRPGADRGSARPPERRLPSTPARRRVIRSHSSAEMNKSSDRTSMHKLELITHHIFSLLRDRYRSFSSFWWGTER